MYTPKGEINDALYEAMKDQAFIEKLASAKTPDDCYEAVKEAGVEVSREEFEKSMEIMKGYLEESQEGILSEEDLDQVAGGKMSGKDAADIALSTISTAAGVAGAIAAAV